MTTRADDRVPGSEGGAIADAVDLETARDGPPGLRRARAPLLPALVSRRARARGAGDLRGSVPPRRARARGCARRGGGEGAARVPMADRRARVGGAPPRAA